MKILVLTDFSDIAEKGLSMAVRLARQLGNSEILLLNYELPTSNSNFSASGDTGGLGLTESDRYMIELIEKSKERLRQEAARFETPDVPVLPYIEVGDIQHVVDGFIHAHKVDMVVMGTSGESTFEEFFVGNHTERVVRIADVPVISVKLNDHERDIKKIVLAIDTDKKATPCLIRVKKLAERLGAELQLVHVAHKDDMAPVKEKVTQFALHHGLQEYSVHVIDHKDTEKGIQEFATSLGADMIAVLTHGHDGLRAMFSHSLAEDMIKDAGVPVLTINMHQVHA